MKVLIWIKHHCVNAVQTSSGSVCYMSIYLFVSLGGFAIDLVEAFKQCLPEGLLTRSTVVSSRQVLTNLIPILQV